MGGKSLSDVRINSTCWFAYCFLERACNEKENDNATLYDRGNRALMCESKLFPYVLFILARPILHSSTRYPTTRPIHAHLLTTTPRTTLNPSTRPSLA